MIAVIILIIILIIIATIVASSIKKHKDKTNVMVAISDIKSLTLTVSQKVKKLDKSYKIEPLN